LFGANESGIDVRGTDEDPAEDFSDPQFGNTTFTWYDDASWNLQSRRATGLFSSMLK